MQTAIKAQFNNALFKTPHDRLIQVSQPATSRIIQNTESIHLHPEKLLWIDADKGIAVLSAFLLPKFSRIDFKGRVVLGFRLGQTKRNREYILAPLDESGHLGHITPVHSPVQRVILGRSGLLHKAFHIGTQTHFISQTPDHHESIRGLMEQVGTFTSDQHLEIGFENEMIEMRNNSPYGTYAFAA